METRAAQGRYQPLLLPYPPGCCILAHSNVGSDPVHPTLLRLLFPSPVLCLSVLLPGMGGEFLLSATYPFNSHWGPKKSRWREGNILTAWSSSATVRRTKARAPSFSLPAPFPGNTGPSPILHSRRLSRIKNTNIRFFFKSLSFNQSRYWGI